MPKNNGRKKKILLVDDSELVREFVKAILEDEVEDVDITEAESGERALDLISEGEFFNLLITDYEMEGMNGIELIKRVFQRSPVRVGRWVLMTSSPERIKEKRVVEEWGIPLLNKEYDLDERLVLLVQRG